jgi:hypothetical protein
LMCDTMCGPQCQRDCCVCVAHTNGVCCTYPFLNPPFFLIFEDSNLGPRERMVLRAKPKDKSLGRPEFRLYEPQAKSQVSGTHTRPPPKHDLSPGMSRSPSWHANSRHALWTSCRTCGMHVLCPTMPTAPGLEHLSRRNNHYTTDRFSSLNV